MWRRRGGVSVRGRVNVMKVEVAEVEIVIAIVNGILDEAGDDEEAYHCWI